MISRLTMYKARLFSAASILFKALHNPAHLEHETKTFGRIIVEDEKKLRRYRAVEENIWLEVNDWLAEAKSK